MTRPSLAVGGWSLMISVAIAQTASAPSFDAVSIRRSSPDTRPSVDVMPGGRFSATRVSLRDLIKIAYPIGDATRNDDQIAGGPAWVGTERFDIVATGGPVSLTRPAAGAVAPPPSAALEMIK